MFLEILNIFTIIFGCITVLLSLGLATIFFKQMNRLGIALGFMFLGESIIGASTVTFSLGTVLTTANVFDPLTQVILRLIIFSAASLTSLHLFYVLRKL